MSKISDRHGEIIPCPVCGDGKYSLWARENEFSAVKCFICGLIYVNPRPPLSKIDETVGSGARSDEALHLNVVGRRVSGKVTRYKKIISEMFIDIIERGQPISWLDVGAGFGEVVEAVIEVVPIGCKVEGIEPMRPKVEQANA